MAKILMNMTEEMKSDLKEAAKARGQSYSALIRQILWDWLEQEKESTSTFKITVNLESVTK